MAFQNGVVYLSPKPRQIRMEFNDLKHSNPASYSVESDAVESDPASHLLLTRWPSHERGSYFNRLFLNDMSFLACYLAVSTLRKGSNSLFALQLSNLLFFRQFSGLERLQKAVRQRELQIVQCTCCCTLAYSLF